MNTDWLPLTELTLQGNLTIAGYAQKTWTAKRGVCEIHLHAKSGVARIDWQHTSVIVSPAVIQHGTLNVIAEHENAALLDHEEAQITRELAVTESAMRAAAQHLKERVQDPNLGPSLTTQSTRADEILAEFDEPKTVSTFRRKPGRKPKAD